MSEKGKSTEVAKESIIVEEEKKEELPVLGPLEEDDEFEEFPADDWEDQEADISHIIKGRANPVGTAGGNATTLDALWEDNWDDDDVEDDFSKKLREVLDSKSGDTPMS